MTRTEIPRSLTTYPELTLTYILKEAQRVVRDR
jgi:hypothetical protein